MVLDLDWDVFFFLQDVVLLRTWLFGSECSNQIKLLWTWHLLPSTYYVGLVLVVMIVGSSLCLSTLLHK